MFRKDVMKMKKNTMPEPVLKSIFFMTLLKKWDAIVVSLVSLAYGHTLFVRPGLIENASVYEPLSQIFNGRTFGCLFMVLGIAKLVSIIFNLKILKVVSVSLLVGIWMLFGITLFQVEVTNTVYIHSFGWALVSFGIVVREWVD